MPKQSSVIAAFLGISTGVHSATGQCDYSLTIYKTSELLGAGSVMDMATFDDGTGPALVVAGNEILPVPGGSSIDTYSIGKWHPETGWTPLGSGLKYVQCVEVFQGILYASEYFGMYAAKWNGQEWIDVSAGLSQRVRDFQVFDDGSGSGPQLFSISKDALYKFDGTSWKSVAEFKGIPNRLLVLNNELVAAGGFTNVADVPANNIARWNGSSWSTFGQGVSGGGIADLVVGELNGKFAVFVSGNFTQAGNLPAHQTAYWDGQNWTPLPPVGQSGQTGVGRLAIWDDGTGSALYASVGSMSSSSGDSWDNLYRLTQNGSELTWVYLGSIVNLPYAYISDMIVFDDGTDGGPSLFIGGKFYRFGSADASNLVRRTPLPDLTFAPLPYDPRAVWGGIASLTMYDAGNGLKLYAAGKFGNLGDAPGYTLVARFDGNAWNSVGETVYNASLASTKVISALDDGTGTALFVGGNFLGIAPFEGLVPERFAKRQGASWSRVGNWGLTVNAMTLHSDGSGQAFLYVACTPGIFPDQYNGVAKWNPIIQSWSGLGSGLAGGGTFGPVAHALASFDAGAGAALYVGGRFESAGGVSAINIARWNGPTAGWSNVGNADGDVHLLHVHDDGSGPRLVAGGGFSTIGGVASHRVAQWNGTSWAPIGDLRTVGFGNTSLKAMTTFDDGSGPALIVSDGTRVARWNGSTWALLPIASAFAFQSDGNVLYVGGGASFSIWSATGAQLAIASQSPDTNLDPNSTLTLQVDVVQGGAVTYQWRRNGTPLINFCNVSGVQTNRLRIFNVSGSHEGVYDVVVSNDCTSVSSGPMDVYVIGTCFGDISNDGQVGADDLLSVLSTWGLCPFPPSCLCPSDIAPGTGDSKVGIADLLAVIEAWGACR